ncbi:hypothetical protein [Roseovarius sp.]|uniref:hypothetical protein n=1 Tax=Roseovarius sp. TaxID=1486281 RepID=UPI0032EFCD1A
MIFAGGPPLRRRLTQMCKAIIAGRKKMSQQLATAKGFFCKEMDKTAHDFVKIFV